MRVIHVDDEREHGFALGQILVSLLEPEPGKAREFNRWYERDHFYAGCMTGAHFFAGRRFIATRELKALRTPASSPTIADTSIGSFLALYWMERGHRAAAEDWALERVLSLGEAGRMAGGGKRRAVHASFYRLRFAAIRDADGVPPEVALDHGFPGVVLALTERPAEVTAASREAWLRDVYLPEHLPGSPIALCLSFDVLPLSESSPVYTPPPEGAERRGLEIFFLDVAPEEAWSPVFSGYGEALAAAGQGSLAMVAGFLPTVPGTDRYVDEV